MNIYVYTYTYIRTCLHICVHIYIRTYTYTHIERNGCVSGYSPFSWILLLVVALICRVVRLILDVLDLAQTLRMVLPKMRPVAIWIAVCFILRAPRATNNCNPLFSH